uniref:SFRICE_016356 n=1 Tax=Spodoptera frugiperda TaxID=7108 RepID=A0A2H1WJ50_SPOFR
MQSGSGAADYLAVLPRLRLEKKNKSRNKVVFSQQEPNTPSHLAQGGRKQRIFTYKVVTKLKNYVPNTNSDREMEQYLTSLVEDTT